MSDPFDLVVVGAGNAGLAAAASAAERGMRTMVLEKTDRTGGQLHWSSGHFSAAGTRRQREKGIDDHPDLHFADVMRMGHGKSSEHLVRMAVDAAPAAVDWLDDLGFPFAGDTPAIVSGHEPYGRPRTYWGGDDPARGGLPLFDALAGASSENTTVQVATGTSVERLLVSQEQPGKRVTGVVLEGGRRIHAEHVVLATGGYAAARDLLHVMQPDHAAALTGCLPHATGDGHRMLMDLDVPMVGTDTYAPTMGMVEDPDHPGFGIPIHEARVIVNALDRLPWEIWVNEEGERFVAEDERSPYVREAALREQPGLAMIVIWDSTALEGAPPVIGPGWTSGEIDAEARHGRWLRRYDALTLLARDQGIPERALAATVAAHNRAGPDPFGRKHRPAKIAASPFYAVRVVGGMLLSRGGPAVDDLLRPRDGAGRPILGLHAVGEILGMGQFSGDSFAGGMSVGPALGLARWLIERLAGRPGRH